MGQALQFEVESQQPALGLRILGLETIAKTDRHAGTSHDSVRILTQYFAVRFEV